MTTETASAALANKPASIKALDEVAAAVYAAPSLLLEPPEVLSERFGVEADFFKALGAAMSAESVEPSFVDVALGAIKRAWRGVVSAGRDLFERWTSKTFACLTISTSIVAVIVVSLGYLGEQLPIANNFLLGGLYVTAFGVVFVLAGVLHAVAYYRSPRARYALATTGIVFAATMASASMLVTSNDVRASIGSGIQISMVLVGTGVVVSGIYLCFAMAATVVGGFAKYRQDTRSETQVDRQELISRMFEIDSRLESLSASGIMVRRPPVLDRVRRSGWLFPGLMLFGLGLGLIDVFGMGLVNSALLFSRGRGAMPELWVAVLGAMLVAAKVGGYLVAGYLGGRPTAAISAIIVVWVGRLFSMIVPYGGFGPGRVFEALSPANLAIGLVGAVVMGLLSGYGALIEDRSYRKKRLRDNDPAALMAEKIYLTRRLRLGQTDTAVMVVDVSKSTEMKAAGNPLDIEWTFREYQQVVAEHGAKHGGEVLSTAGDGAVLAFATPSAAVMAGREILTELPSFNARRNRIGKPFRLRIGIHVGETQTNLADAPYNELIDIAAHIEQVCPVGGIAVSGAVAAVMSDAVPLAELAHHVDGQSVHLVLNPVLE